jgi:hypothetical protein
VRAPLPTPLSAAAVDAALAADAAPTAVPIGQLPLEQRQALAEQWGYKTIGAELPDNVTLTDVVKSMPSEVGCCFGGRVWRRGGAHQDGLRRPAHTHACMHACMRVCVCAPSARHSQHRRDTLTPPHRLPRVCCGAQVFQINPLKAWSAVGITLASVAASLYLISVSPWYLLPFAWFIAGTAFTGVSSVRGGGGSAGSGRSSTAPRRAGLGWPVRVQWRVQQAVEGRHRRAGTAAASVGAPAGPVGLVTRGGSSLTS